MTRGSRHSASITADRDFSAFPQLKVRNPLVKK